MTPTPETPTIAAQIEALAPCPFCGGEAKRFTIGEDEPNNAGGDVIACTQCQASSHVEFGYKENLVSLWNTRAPAIAIEPDAYGNEGDRSDCLTCGGRGIDYGETCVGCGGLGWILKAPAIVTALRQAEAAPGVVEAAARIIDPSAWGDLGHDSYLQRADEWFAKGRPEDDVLVGGYRQKAAEMVKPSLAKAAAVLALARQHGAREGMVLVPREPTEAMLAHAPNNLMSAASLAILWRDLIAAAPAADVGEG